MSTQEDSVPSYAERGQLGAAKRWGPRRRLRIGDLDPDQRREVNDLIAAKRAENERRAKGGER